MKLKDPGKKQTLVWRLDRRTVPSEDEICSLNEEARAVCGQWNNLVVLDVLLYHKGNNSLGFRKIYSP